MGCGATKAVPPKESIMRRISNTWEENNVCGSAVRAQKIDGKKLSDEHLALLKEELTALQAAGLPVPCLAVILVGDNPASLSYIKRKEKAAVGCGMTTRLVQLPTDVTQSTIMAEVEALNSDSSVHGVLVQLPLPDHLDAPAVTNAVLPVKDVDGLTTTNIGAVALNGYKPLFGSCTPKGCVELIKSVGEPLVGKEAVVVGASNIVGIPLSLMLIGEGCTVTVCHIDTVDTAAHARNADILVVAVGKAGLVTKEWVKPGAIVIDVGINFIDDSSTKSGKRMVGDVAFDEVMSVAGHITPVPGGVGPMTVAMLMSNTVDAAKSAHAAKL